jgi:hypothetical protein
MKMLASSPLIWDIIPQIQKGMNSMPILSIRLLRASCVCAVSAVLVACGGGSGDDSTDIPFARVQGDFSGSWPVQTYVARTDAEWSQIWSQHVPNFSLTPKPVIDFTAFTVVGISLGLGSNGCDGLEITRVAERPNEIEVDYHRLPVSSGQGCTANLVPLVDFVEIGATSKPIIFVSVS